MYSYKADFHIHTLLSPCGDLNMTPRVIVERALLKGLDIIGITDHNSTLHCGQVVHFAKKKGPFVLAGAEVTTKEEVHCLCFFKDQFMLADFQLYLDSHIPDIMNDPEYFGDQVQIDSEENIIFEEKRLLTSALRVGIDELSAKVSSLNGIFVPAHIDRPVNSIISQLGYFPTGLEYDAVEISGYKKKEEIIGMHPYLKDKCFIRGSDAHFPERIGVGISILEMSSISFEEIRKTLSGVDGRKVILG